MKTHHHSIQYNLERVAENLGIVVEAVCIKFPVVTVQLAKETYRKVKAS